MAQCRCIKISCSQLLECLDPKDLSALKLACFEDQLPVELCGVEANGLVECAPLVVIKVHRDINRQTEEAGPQSCLQAVLIKELQREARSLKSECQNYIETALVVYGSDFPGS